jgi:vancomycin resistance protein YoaR
MNDEERKKDDIVDDKLEQETIIENVKNNEISRRPRRNIFKNKKLIIITLIILFVILIGCGIFVILNKMNNKVYNNIYLNKANISNFTEEELIKYIEKNSHKNINIEIYQNEDNIYNLKSSDLDFEVDISKTVKRIMEYGRKDNIIIDNFKILKTYFLGSNFEFEYVYNSEKLDNQFKNIDLSIKDRHKDDKFSIDEINHKLNIVIGTKGKGIDEEETKLKLIDILKTRNSSKYKLNIKDTINKPIDINELQNQVVREPVDAYIDESVKPPKFVSEKVGYNIDIKSLNNILSKPENKVEGKIIIIDLEVLQPKVKLVDLTYSLFNDKLSGYTTYFNAADKNRAKNLEIALGYLNGKILMPGEVFSYVNTVGDINSSRGYMPASTFKAGTIVQEVGGGICQTSSTLYNVAITSNLQIIERHAHGLPVGYVRPSTDATIYDTILDLKFKNTRNYPVKIVTSFSPTGNMNISIFGTKEEKEYDISIDSQMISTIPFSTKYIYDPNMDEGTSVVVNGGVNGYISQSFVIKKLNGQFISNTFLSKDTYNSQQQTIKVGTRKVYVPIDNNVNIY